jgi:hypothetical protein
LAIGIAQPQARGLLAKAVMVVVSRRTTSRLEMSMPSSRGTVVCLGDFHVLADHEAEVRRWLSNYQELGAVRPAAVGRGQSPGERTLINHAVSPRSVYLLKQ